MDPRANVDRLPGSFPDRLDDVIALARAVEDATGVDPFGDATWRGLRDPEPGRDVAFTVDHDGGLAAYAHLEQHHPGQWSVELAVAPTASGADPVDAADLLVAASEAVAEAGGGHLTWWVHGAEITDEDVATTAGFTHERALLQMRVPLPLPVVPTWPPGVTVRPFEPGRDEDAWLTVNNRAFADHPEQGGWTHDTLVAREGDPWFEPLGFLLAFDEDGLAGFCWTKVHEPAPPREPDALGEIYVIGADPSRQGTGLGRALTVGGLEWLASRGITVGMLYVDAANEAATGLYRALGFVEHRVDRAFSIDVEARDAPDGGPSAPVVTATARYGIAREQLDATIAELGVPRYRAQQVWDALYGKVVPLEEATTLPGALREQLAVALPPSLRLVTEQTAADEQTSKWLWACTSDDAQIETVLMRYPTRATVCVSSQAGCAMGCTFCATGQAGFERQLTAAEIVEQVARAAHASPQRISNVVFMGMGEPLANYEQTWAAIERIHADFGISARRITVSTVGVVPGIRRLATEDLPVTLAVSLHAADDAQRSELVPLNRRYPIAEVLDAAAAFAAAKGRRVSFEYACIADVNDTPEEAERLGRLLGRFPGAGGAHVNLIPLNPTAGFDGVAAIGPRLEGFVERLRAHGVQATVRRNRGTDIAAACGQLRERRAHDEA